MKATEWLNQTLSGFDSSGTGVGLTYLKKSTHGTVVGGLCSILATIIIVFFIFSEFYALIVTPEFNQNV